MLLLVLHELISMVLQYRRLVKINHGDTRRELEVLRRKLKLKGILPSLPTYHTIVVICFMHGTLLKASVTTIPGQLEPDCAVVSDLRISTPKDKVGIRSFTIRYQSGVHEVGILGTVKIIAWWLYCGLLIQVRIGYEVYTGTFPPFDAILT